MAEDRCLVAHIGPSGARPRPRRQQLRHRAPSGGSQRAPTDPRRVRRAAGGRHLRRRVRPGRSHLVGPVAVVAAVDRDRRPGRRAVDDLGLRPGLGPRLRVLQDERPVGGDHPAVVPHRHRHGGPHPFGGLDLAGGRRGRRCRRRLAPPRNSAGALVPASAQLGGIRGGVPRGLRRGARVLDRQPRPVASLRGRREADGGRVLHRRDPKHDPARL